MNNEAKILEILDQLKEGQAVTNARLDGIDSRLEAIEQDVSELKEETREMRVVVNMIGKWVDQVANISEIKFPVEEMNKEQEEYSGRIIDILTKKAKV